MIPRRKDWIIGGVTICDNMRFMSPKALAPLVSVVFPVEKGTTCCTHEEDWQKGLWVSDVKKAQRMPPKEAKRLVKMLRDGYDKRIKIKAMPVEQGLAYMVSNELRSATENDEDEDYGV